MREYTVLRGGKFLRCVAEAPGGATISLGIANATTGQITDTQSCRVTGLDLEMLAGLLTGTGLFDAKGYGMVHLATHFIALNVPENNPGGRILTMGLGSGWRTSLLLSPAEVFTLAALLGRQVIYEVTRGAIEEAPRAEN